MQHDHGLTITHRSPTAGVHVLAVHGDLDHHTSPRLQEALDALAPAGGDLLVIDLTELPFCDSTGVSVLVAAHQRAQDAGVRLALAGLHADLAHIFKIMGLDRLLSFYDSTDDAIAALR
ncbi:STAS domain-containing protein [Actinomadura sp. ATCC 31491]|uniref:Anti-sigma factor antagonist n=1 Tax=Actinomadura luzonensis TaxID=2805427 RepID=A0ABT0GD07_9ACTN|nr:STAS domain-containing protein [Actinomadura luzonensis]MCK2221986.1 STAS domain-containing protein [Actinomadura luzonensis]